MNRCVKITLGIATFCPIVGIVLSFAYVFLMLRIYPEVFIAVYFAMHAENIGSESLELFRSPVVLGLVLIELLTLFSFIVLDVIYLVLVIKNKRFAIVDKFLWGVVLTFGSVLAMPALAMPAYWIFFIWHDSEKIGTIIAPSES